MSPFYDYELWTSRIQVEALTKCLNQCLVGRFRDEFHRRAAISPRNPEGGKQKNAGNHKVLPAIERPLAVPGELNCIREWLEVRDGPLVAIGAASADKVAEYVQVEADEDQDRGESRV